MRLVSGTRVASGGGRDVRRRLAARCVSALAAASSLAPRCAPSPLRPPPPKHPQRAIFLPRHPCVSQIVTTLRETGRGNRSVGGRRPAPSEGVAALPLKRLHFFDQCGLDVCSNTFESPNQPPLLHLTHQHTLPESIYTPCTVSQPPTHSHKKIHLSLFRLSIYLSMSAWTTPGFCT